MSNSGDDDKIGYCKPPKHTQFKKGQSGNPSGRRKRDQTVVDPNPMRAVLLEEVETMSKGKKTKMLSAVAVARRFVKMAMNGDHKAARLVFDKCGGLDTLLYWKPGKGSN